MENTLMSVLPNWYALLQGWALDGSLTAAAQEALLLDGEPKALKNLVSQWAAGDYSGLPPIVLLSSADINGAKGAYAISTGTIYLNADWLATATQEAVNAVLTEELGHYLDGLLNTVDTSGDEGEYFSDLLREVVLTDSQKSFLRAENDGGSVKADGTTLGVEFATTSPVKEWTQLLGSSGTERARSVATASDGSIYITGYTTGNLDGKTKIGWIDAFLSKYNSNGSKAWTQLLGSSAVDEASSVTTASDGSIYITGYTWGNLDGKTNSGGYDAFLSKYNSNGSKAWTQLLGSSAEDVARSVATASDGSIYIAGYTGGNLDAKTNSGVNDVFLSKFNGDGSKAWTQLLGSSAADEASSVTTASDGSIYITGYTGGNLDGKTNSGDTDAFISKFSDADIFKVPIVTLAVSPASVLEDGTTSLVYTFSRTGPTTNALTVNYSIAGTANAADYTGATPGTGKTITFAANSATATLTIDPTADSTIESDETVVLTLASGTGYTIGTAGAITGTITNGVLEGLMAPVIRGNSLYTIVDGPSWTQAEANSVKLGGNLITFNNKEELFWVQYVILSDTKIPKVSYFTGLNDVRQEGNYEWSSGQRDDWSNVTDLIHRQNWIAQQQSIAPTHDYTAIGWGDRGFRGDYTQEYRPDLYNNKFGTIGWVDNTNSWAKTQYGQDTLGISETPFIRRGDSAYVIVQGPTWEEAEANAVKLGVSVQKVGQFGANIGPAELLTPA